MPRVNPFRRQLVLGLAATPLLPSCSSEKRLASRTLGPTDRILCIGDSLTRGHGASPGADYPNVLSQLTGIQVLNSGVSGDTSEGVAGRLPRLLKSLQIGLVLVGVGGNDFLRQVPLERTRVALERIVQSVETPTQLVLIAEPKPNLLAAAVRSLSDHELYRSVADATKTPLYSNGWSSVLSDPSLRSDPIHPNDEGYATFARGLARWLKATGFVD